MKFWPVCAMLKLIPKTLLTERRRAMLGERLKALRKSKQSYKPVYLLRKYAARWIGA